MGRVVVRFLLLAALLPTYVGAANIRGEQHQRQENEGQRQLFMDSKNNPISSGRGNNFGFMNELDDSTSSNSGGSTTTAACPACKSFCGGGASRLEVCIIETNVTLCLKKSVFYGSLCPSVARCGSCNKDPATQQSAGPCSDNYLCDSGGNGPRKYQVCRMLGERKNVTMCVNELSGIFQSKNITCGACPVKASPCADTFLCDSNGNGNNNNNNNNGPRKYQVCRVTNEGKNVTVCANENSDIFNSTNTTCGACPAKASPCADTFLCDSNGNNNGNNNNKPRKYQVCRVTSAGKNVTMCANENSDIFNSTNTTCGACPTKAGPCADTFLCDSNGNNNGNNNNNGPRKYQVCRVTSAGKNVTMCANENSDIFNSTNTTCGACPAKASPCADTFLCDSNGNGNGNNNNKPRKYQVCRVTSAGKNVTMCANENSDIFNSTNTTCGACKVVVGSNGNGNGNNGNGNGKN